MSEEKTAIPTPCDGYCIVEILAPQQSAIILAGGAEDNTELQEHRLLRTSGRHLVGMAWVESAMQEGDILVLAPGTKRVMYPQRCEKNVAIVRLMDVAAYFADPARVMQ